MHAVIDAGGTLVSIPALVMLGAVVGLLAGMFGVGGGFLLTPLLAVVLRVPLPIAIGSGLCQIIGTSIAALLRHRRYGQGEIRFDLLMLAGCIMGVDAGTRTLSRLEHSGSITIHGARVALAHVVIDGAYAALLTLVAAMFWRQGGGTSDPLAYVRNAPLARIQIGPAMRLPSVAPVRASAILVAEIGLALGFLSGLLGIGGGVALMPVLIYGFGFPMRQAAGTGILVLVATSVVGTVEHALRGHVNLPLAMTLLVGSSLSAQAGAALTHRLSARRLRRVFAAVVLLTVFAVLWDLARRLW